MASNVHQVRVPREVFVAGHSIGDFVAKELKVAPDLSRRTAEQVDILRGYADPPLRRTARQTCETVLTVKIKSFDHAAETASCPTGERQG